MSRPLMLVSNRTRPPQGSPAVNGQDAPRQDYVEIVRRLGGVVKGYDLPDRPWYRWVRRIEQQVGLDVIEALAFARQARLSNVVVSASEKIALPLAALLALSRRSTPHVLIAHKLSSGTKTRLWRFGFQHRFARIICLCQTQARYAVEQLGVAADRVGFVRDKVDQRFFQPSALPEGDFVLAVGQERRDYATLIKALAGSGIRLVVVASSLWAQAHVRPELSADVRVISNIPYTKLRDLYARARLVVVPLHSADYAAGVNAVLEAMAMAKALIVSRTPGIVDYVVADETAALTPVGDAAALRQAIDALWNDAQTRRRLGANARQCVDEQMNLDLYVDDVVRHVHEAIAGRAGDRRAGP